MTPQTVNELVRSALMTAFWLGLPMLALGFVVGIVISLIQIVTSFQDAGFSTIPRLVAFVAGLVFVTPWMCTKMMDYTTALFGDLARYAR